jgi:hypothetical protein
VGDLNNLDKEVIKGDAMNTDIIYEILRKMEAEDSSEPDYQRIRNNLFPKWSKRSNIVKFNRRVVAASITLFAMLLITTTALAAWVIYERVFTVERVPTYQTPPFGTTDEMNMHIGEDILIPRELPEGYTVGLIQGFDFLSFQMRLIKYENSGEQVALSIFYDFDNIEDIFFHIPRNIGEQADIKINGISVMQSQQSRVGMVSSYWEIDGVYYILMGVYTLEELAVIINSIH